MDTIIIIFFGIFGLGLLVLVHELGHFFAARLCGVQVETFSIGFGKKLLGFTRNGIKYQLSWFLLGGYCKLKGEMFRPDFTEEDFKKAKKEKGSFLASTSLKKIIIVAAGPLANLFFAAIIFAILAFIGFTFETSGTKVILQTDYSMENNDIATAAGDAGLKTGDEIIAIDGKEMKHFGDIYDVVSKSQGKELLFTVKRDNDVLKFPVSPEEVPGKYISRIGIYPWDDPVIESVEKSSPAAIAGLQQGDVLIAIDDVPIEHSIAYYYALFQKPASLTLTYTRNDEKINTIMHLTWEKETVFETWIRFKRLQVHSPKYNPFMALVKGGEKTIEVLGLIVQSFAILFRVGVKDVSDVVAGPIRITQMIGQQALSGFDVGFGAGISNFFNFICLISVLLGFMNLLPIPVLDGGHIILACIMGVKKTMGPKFVMRYQLVGFSIIIMLTVLAVFSDIFYFL